MVIVKEETRKWKVKRKKTWRFGGLTFLFVFLLSCTSQPTPQTQIVTIFYSPAAETVLDKIYACASEYDVVLQVKPENPDIYLQFGEPDVLLEYAYQVDVVELVVAVNVQSTLQELSQVDVQNLFSDSTRQVWVYVKGDEMQQVFEQFAMAGRGVSSTAKMVADVNIMAEMLSADVNLVGLLPQNKLTQNLRAVYSVGEFPILAVANVEPKNGLKNVLGCAQKN